MRNVSRIQSIADKFWAKVNKHGPYPHKKACKAHPEIKGTRCWLWEGYIDKDGYGANVRFNYKAYQAHRIAWMLSFGKITKGFGVFHKCDVRNCERPLHLFQGTAQDNSNDKLIKNRQSRGFSHRLAQDFAGTRSCGLKHALVCKKFPGEINGNAKLTNKQAFKIRKMYASGKYTQQALSILFNVVPMSILRIINYKTFRY